MTLPSGPGSTLAVARGSDRLNWVERQTVALVTQPATRWKPPVNTYIEFSCPGCHHALRVRTEYLGKRISCKYCSHVFQAVATTGDVQPTAAGPAAPPQADAAAEAARQQVASLETALQQARGELAERAATHADEARRASEEIARLEEQVRALQGA